MNDSLKDEAALYALGLLEPEEASRFEAELARDAELRAYFRGLGDTMEELAAGVPSAAPPARLRERVLREISLGAVPGPALGPVEAAATTGEDRPARGKVIAFPSSRLAWGLAAALTLSTAFLAVDRFRVERRMEALRRSDNLSRLQLYALLNVPGGPAASARATVAYDAERGEGLLEVAELPPRPAGKDYQLWSLEVGEKDTTKAISNGVVRLDANGVGKIRFRPVKAPGRPLSIFAIALEEEGGAAVHVGPVVMKARPRVD